MSLVDKITRGASSDETATGAQLPSGGREMPCVTLFGYGSLLNAASTALTCKSATNRRIGVLRGYQRVFSLVSISTLRSDPAAAASLEIAALGIHPVDGFIVGVLFDIDEAELEGIAEPTCCVLAVGHCGRAAGPRRPAFGSPHPMFPAVVIALCSILLKRGPLSC
jgi:hypothetical protein